MMYRLIFLFSFLGALFGRTHAAKAAPEHDPRALTIYQVMVASFQHDPSGAPGYTQMWGPDHQTKNGNLAGIIAALPYIKSLGANAIWLTPVFDSTDAFGGEKLQATGYFTRDYFKIDPHFGTEAEFHELVDKAHSLGMYVLLDGVFGHHGGVTTPSPSGYTIDSTISGNDSRDDTGNVAYPGSLDYFKEVATWWMDNYGVDGWRLDQAYQACQGGHNYWIDIREAVEDKARERKARGEKWGTLGYMVGEDWGPAEVINEGVYRDGGLLSAFDFDGKERISGKMQDYRTAGLENGWRDVELTLRTPTQRGYLNDTVMPNLYLSNHDGYRVADRFDPKSDDYYRQLMTRNAILAAYNGPITLYYGDEYADRTLETTGGQPDNVARTSGHLEPRNAGEKELRDYIAAVMKARGDNPALWRGTPEFVFDDPEHPSVLQVTKVDPVTGNTVAVIFSTLDDIRWPYTTDMRATATDLVNGQKTGPFVTLQAFKPTFLKLK